MLWDTFKEFKNGELVLNQPQRETYKERAFRFVCVQFQRTVNLKHFKSQISGYLFA